MVDYFREYEVVSAGTPLRQGDVLESIDSAAPMWARHLIVLTADCDLAFAKHQGRITCVPLLMSKEYLHEFKLPALREERVKTALSEIEPILDSVRPEHTFSKIRLASWATDEAPEDIVTALGARGNEALRLRELFSAMRHFTRETPDFVTAVSELTAGTQYLRPKAKNVKESLLKEIRNAFSQTPGDAMFISAIGESDQQGYFAYLRHLEQVMEPHIDTGTRTHDSKYRRISRLQDRFAHALVQRFAMVYMSIGLPTDYEEIRDLHALSIDTEQQ